MLVGAVVADEIDDDPNPAGVASIEQVLEVGQGAVFGVDREIVRHIVTMVGRRGIDGHEPDAGHAEVIRGGGIAIVEVVQLGQDALKVPYAVSIAVLEGPNENLVESGLCLPRGRCDLTTNNLHR